MSEVKKKFEQYLESQEADDILTLIAFTIRATPTLKDDEIVDNIDDIKDLLSEKIDQIADVKPTEKQAKTAGVRLLEKIAALTKTKWDDRIVSALKMFI